MTRAKSIDYMKGLLTVLMVLSHTFDFTLGSAGNFSNYVNLTTFSGFLFCFGYASYKAYISKDKLPVRKLVTGSLKLFAAYYISAFAYTLFIEKHMTRLMSYFRQTKLAGWSEFLVSWAYLYLILIIAIPLIKLVKKTKIPPVIPVVILVIVSLMCTHVPYDSIKPAWIGPVIGRATGVYFPLVQYSSYFIIGAYIAYKKIGFNKIIFIASLAGSGYFLWYTKNNGLPERWKVALAWIVGAYAVVYLYYLLFHAVEKKGINLKVLEFIGRNTLIYLVVSNICNFALKRYVTDLPGIPMAVKIIGGYLFAMTACAGVSLAKTKLFGLIRKK